MINTFASGAPIYSNCVDEGALGFGNRKIAPVLCRHHLSPGGIFQGPDQQPVHERICQPYQQLALPLLPVTETAPSNDSRSCQPHCEALPLQVCRSGNTEEFRRLLAANPGIAKPSIGQRANAT